MSGVTDVQHLVVRLPNWLGDTVMALPVLRALRSGLDGRRITLVGPWAPLLIGQGVAEGGGAYAPGARKRPPVPRRHQVDEYLGLLGPLGIDGAEATPRWLPEGDAQNERLEALLPSGGVDSRPRIGIHLGAAFGPSKLWPAELIAGLCRELRQRRLVPVLLGTPSEEVIANGIVAATGGDVVSLVGRDAPELLPGLLARLDALVSMDTGVAHLAAAVGVPAFPVRMKRAWDLFAVQRLVALIPGERVDLVNTHSSVDAWLGGMAARLARIPVVRSRHVSIPIRRRLNPVYTLLADRVITSGEAIRRLVIAAGVSPDRVVAVPAGVDLAEFSRPAGGDRIRREFGLGRPGIG